MSFFNDLPVLIVYTWHIQLTTWSQYLQGLDSAKSFFVSICFIITGTHTNSDYYRSTLIIGILLVHIQIINFDILWYRFLIDADKFNMENPNVDSQFTMVI